jgi:hypothetical protein
MFGCCCRMGVGFSRSPRRRSNKNGDAGDRDQRSDRFISGQESRGKREILVSSVCECCDLKFLGLANAECFTLHVWTATRLANAKLSRQWSRNGRQCPSVFISLMI